MKCQDFESWREIKMMDLQEKWLSQSVSIVSHFQTFSNENIPNLQIPGFYSLYSILVRMVKLTFELSLIWESEFQFRHEIWQSWGQPIDCLEVSVSELLI